MAKSHYNFYQDPGHGWIKVKREELKKLGIHDKITTCSYQRGEDVFLEEDCDFTTFELAKRAHGQQVIVKNHVARGKSSKIRSYDYYVA